MKELYRYIGFEEFVDILVFERLILKYPGKWEDKLEVLFLRYLENNKLDELFVQYYESQKNNPQYNVLGARTELSIIFALLLQVRCQCWTEEEDNYDMWKNPYRKIRIAVKKQSLEKIESKEGKLTLNTVNYMEEVDLKNTIKLFNEDRVLKRFVTSKKNIYKNEKEHRLILTPPDWNFMTDNGDGFTQNLNKYLLYIHNQYVLRDKTVDFQTNNIINVKISPYATENDEELIEEICNIKGIKCLGKSRILD